MKNKPKISIIIPVYNGEKYLRECLNSVLNQSFFHNIEVICINDGSTDVSLDILNEYSRKNNSFKIINQAKMGVSAARNRGIEESIGEFLYFMDGDDYIDPKLAETTYKIAVKNNADIVVFGGKAVPSVQWVDNNLNTGNHIVEDTYFALFNVTGSRPFVWNKLFKRELVKNNNITFDTTLELCEDHAFIFDIFPYAKKIVFTNKKLYFYKQHSNSALAIFNRTYERKMTFHIKMIKYVLLSWKEKGFIIDHENEMITWIVSFLCEDLKKCPYNFKIECYKSLLGVLSEINPANLNLRSDIQHEMEIIKKYVELDGKTDISIIMPVYNSEVYLYETLNCLKQQTIPNFEIIFIDDGSSDQSLEILNDYAKGDRRVTVLSQQHKFAGTARNYGMKYAAGEYLLFLDSDDFFAPDMMEIAYEEIKKASADICVFAADQYDHQTNKKSSMRWTCNTTYCPKESNTFSIENNSLHIFDFTTPAPWNKLFRKDFILNNNIEFQNSRSANDMAFVMTALSLAKSIVAIDNVLLTYRVNNNRSLQGSQDKKPDAFYEALLELKRRLIYYNVYDKIKPAFINFALDFCFYNLSTLASAKAYEEVFFLIRNTALDSLEIKGKTENYFYAYPSNKIYKKYQDILNLSIFEFASKYNAPFMNNIVERSEITRKLSSEIEEIKGSGIYHFIRIIKIIPEKAGAQLSLILNKLENSFIPKVNEYGIISTVHYYFKKYVNTLFNNHKR